MGNKKPSGNERRIKLKNLGQAEAFAKQHHIPIRHGGDHDVAENDRGQCALPRHGRNRDWPTGTAHAITVTLLGMAGLLSVLMVAIRLGVLA